MSEQKRRPGAGAQCFALVSFCLCHSGSARLGLAHLHGSLGTLHAWYHACQPGFEFKRSVRLSDLYILPSDQPPTMGQTEDKKRHAVRMFPGVAIFQPLEFYLKCLHIAFLGRHSVLP